jgi:hypothetical protein
MKAMKFVVSIHAESVTGVGRRHALSSPSGRVSRAMKETRYLLSIPGMKKSILRGLKTPITKCVKKLPW